MVSQHVNYGVRTVTVGSERADQRLDNFLARYLHGLPRAAIYRLIRTGQVRVNGGRARPSRRLEPGDEVRIPPARVAGRTGIDIPPGALRQLEAAIIYEDADFLVLDKPAGLAVHGGSGVRWGVIDAIRKLRPDDTFELAHRLDRETSGCLLLARNTRSLRNLHVQFRGQQANKQYLALMDGVLPEDKVVVDAPLSKQLRSGERFMAAGQGGKPAVTEFRRLENYSGYSFVEARPVTGRTHQIRAHAAHLGLALAGDPRYASGERLETWKRKGLDRLFLHAHALTINDADGVPRQWTCGLPQDLRDFLNTFKG